MIEQKTKLLRILTSKKWMVKERLEWEKVHDAFVVVVIFHMGHPVLPSLNDWKELQFLELGIFEY